MQRKVNLSRHITPVLPQFHLRSGPASRPCRAALCFQALLIEAPPKSPAAPCLQRNQRPFMRTPSPLSALRSLALPTRIHGLAWMHLPVTIHLLREGIPLAMLLPLVLLPGQGSIFLARLATRYFPAIHEPQSLGEGTGCSSR